MIDKQELRRLAEEALPAWGLYPTNAQYAFSDALTPAVILALLDELQACKEELRITENLLQARDRLIAEIPECPDHGPNCLPHARDWIRSNLVQVEPVPAINWSDGRCMVCSGQHGGLPCPKMTPMAGNGKDG